MKTAIRLMAPLLAAVVVLSAGTALAAPGIASTAANVRSGPGLGYKVVDQLDKGEYVIVKSCGGSWCLIGHIGKDGYVARTLLYNPYYGSRHYYQFPPKYPNPGRTIRR